MRFDNSLHREFAQLKSEKNSQSRGRMFEALVQKLFERSRFRVHRNVGAARPRQTDLFASYDDRHYLIEVKWRKKRADANDIDSLRARLNRTQSNVAGVFFSMTGFTEPAIKEISENRMRTVLLFDGNEIEKLFDGLKLRRMIARKEEALMKDGRVLFDTEGSLWANRPKPERSTLAAPDISIWSDTQAIAWITGKGGFNSVVFVQDLPDVNWTTAQGVGVGFDVNLNIGQQQDLAYILDILRELGWVTSSGRFSIQQSGITWHGTGAGGFLDALERRKPRYAEAGNAMHHTEEAIYFDVCEGGLYTLFLQIEAHAKTTAYSRLYMVSLSAQLPGIPLDLWPFRRLAEDLDLDDDVHFRPLVSEEIHRAWNLSLPRIRLEVTGFLRAPPGNEPEDWIAGVVARNPFYKKPGAQAIQALDDEDLVRHLAESELLICRLRSWHNLGHAVEYYYLGGLEATKTGDVTVFHVVADWTDRDRRKRTNDVPPLSTRDVITLDSSGEDSPQD